MKAKQKPGSQGRTETHLKTLFNSLNTLGKPTNYVGGKCPEH